MLRLALLLLTSLAAPKAQEATRPNLLVVVTDDQRWDQMGCAGHPVLQTPAMDGLAEKGVRFTSAFVTTAICAASRATILTGRREGEHGYTFGKPSMGDQLAKESYPAQLRSAGYRTGFVGKWGVQFEAGTMDQAFDSFRPMGPPYRREGEAHLTERTADAAIDFLLADDALPGEDRRPFCLSISFNAPHAEDSHRDQYIPPADLEGLYGDAHVPEPALAEEGFAALPAFLQDSMGRDRWFWRFDSRDKQVRRTKDYWRMITGVDRALGRVLDALDRAGVAGNTVVLLIGDNGYFLGERGLAGKWWMYERSIRVPLLIFDPRAAEAQGGSVVDAMALNLDVAPTLLGLAGLDAPKGYSGRSLEPWLAGEEPAWRRDFLYEHRMVHERIPTSFGVRGQRFAYMCWDGQDPVAEQLFDLGEDPDQLVDLVPGGAHGAVLERMRERVKELRGN